MASNKYKQWSSDYWPRPSLWRAQCHCFQRKTSALRGANLHHPAGKSSGTCLATQLHPEASLSLTLLHSTCQYCPNPYVTCTQGAKTLSECAWSTFAETTEQHTGNGGHSTTCLKLEVGYCDLAGIGSELPDAGTCGWSLFSNVGHLNAPNFLSRTSNLVDSTLKLLESTSTCRAEKSIT